jgi:hypothetical protein
MGGAPNPSGAYPGSGHAGRGAAAPARSFEDRAAAKEQMMQWVRESSQQDRRVYVGNLAYDVKWHHLKDFMRQGQNHVTLTSSRLLTVAQLEKFSLLMSYFFRMECRRWAPLCDVAGFSGLSLVIFVGRWIDGLDLVHGFCRDAGMFRMQACLQKRC